MSYLHIGNLYREQTILLFRECYALEKIHGTSAHITWKDGQVRFSSGGSKHETFITLFDIPKLIEALILLGHDAVTVYGEAYGGKQQSQKWRYGDKLKFVAFDVRIGELWLAVPQALDVVTKLGLKFVHFAKVPTDLAALDAERDAPSEQSRRNGVVGDKPREGVVLRPLIELRGNDDARIICKHKRAEERETATERPVVDPALLAVLTHANEIADEWVTPTRLAHVLDKLPDPKNMGQTGVVIAAMIEDVLREGAGEIVDSREARTAIGKKTAELFKAKLKAASASQEDEGAP